MQNHQSQLINAFVYIYTSVKDVQVEVLDKQLIRWKRDQQLASDFVHQHASQATSGATFG